jgi:hypothetical protein
MQILILADYLALIAAQGKTVFLMDMTYEGRPLEIEPQVASGLYLLQVRSKGYVDIAKVTKQ